MALTGSVLFVHGVGGPAPGWDEALADAIARAGGDVSDVGFHTLRYDDILADGTGAALDVQFPLAPQQMLDLGKRQGEGGEVQPTHLTRRQLQDVVADSVSAPEGTDGARRVRLPIPVPGDLVARIPFAGMPHAAAYRWDENRRSAARRRVVDAIVRADAMKTAPTHRIGAGTAEPYEAKGGGVSAPIVVIAHSLGSVVTVDALLAHGVSVDLLVTIGSPIGVDRVWCQEWERDGVAGGGDIGDGPGRVTGETPPEKMVARLIPAWLNVVNTRDAIPWGRGVQPRFPQAVDAFITSGRMMMGPGGAHDPQVYNRSTVVSTAVALALAN